MPRSHSDDVFSPWTIHPGLDSRSRVSPIGVSVGSPFVQKLKTDSELAVQQYIPVNSCKAVGASSRTRDRDFIGGLKSFSPKIYMWLSI